MFLYLFSFINYSNKNSKNTKIYNSDNFVDLELGLKKNNSLSTPLSTPLSTNPKNNKFFPTILIH